MKIILIRFSSLGDCILLCPLASSLKARGAEEVVVVTKTDFAEVFEAAEGVDRVVAFDDGTGIRGLVRIAREFRNRGYRLIDAHNTLRSRLLSGLLGGADARLAKYYRERVSLILWKRRARIPTMLQRYGALAGCDGGSPARLSPGGIRIPEAAGNIVARHRDGRRAVAVAPGSRWPMKRWETEKFTRLVRWLIEQRGCRVFLVGDARDRPVTERIRVEIAEGCTDVAGQTSLLESGALISVCAAFVGNDSGMMHLAEALGVPVLGLFGPTVEAFGYYPVLPGSRTIERDLPCRPCSRNGSRPCPRGTQECMTGIEVETVIEALDGILAGSLDTSRVVLS